MEAATDFRNFAAMKHLIVVAGPTASGKTSLSIALAQHFGTAILSADSRQFYREMAIGTAKPTPTELQAAPHHFIDSLSIHDPYTVGDYERDALARIAQLHEQHDVLIMVGGSGLFIQAVCRGLDAFPTVQPGVREALNALYAEQGIAALQQELAAHDPDYYAQVDRQNPVRLIRALEVIRSSGRPFSAFRRMSPPPRPFHTTYLAIDWPRETLYARIDRRVELMLEAGLEAEARSLYPLRHLNALQTVGYQEWYPYFEGQYDRAEVIRLIQRNSRRYAKRQLTWLRRIPEVHYLAPDALADAPLWLSAQLDDLA